MTTETRYDHAETWTVNTVTGGKLITTGVDSFGETTSKLGGADVPDYMCVRIYRVRSDGTKTMLANWTESAAITKDNLNHIASISVPISELALATTDAIELDVTACWGSPRTYGNVTTFITGQLGTTILNGATWTVYVGYIAGYYGKADHVYFEFDYSGAESRIENFKYGEAAGGAISQGDGLVFWG